MIRPHWTTFARGQRRTPGTMNGLETKYAEHLERLKLAGDVLWFRFEGLTFRLADRCRYTPDFVVMRPTGQIELHEIKGFFADDALVKIKLAAELFPFKFIAVKKEAKKNGGAWTNQEY
jgi:hypothetical protein